jgi:hypothetical protein
VSDGTNVNELTHQRLTDIGRAPTFYDCLVEVAADGAGADRAPGRAMRWRATALLAVAAGLPGQRLQRRWATTARRSAATST